MPAPKVPAGRKGEGKRESEERERDNALERATALDPFECRRYVEERFSSERMVRDYEEAYRAVLDAGADGGERLLEVGDQVAD